MGIAEDVIDGLKSHTRDLEQGERIVVTTIEVCGCNSKAPIGQLAERSGACHLCGGNGFIIDAATLLPGKVINRSFHGGVLKKSRRKL